MSKKINYWYNSIGGYVCSECGALVMNVNLHTEFHEKLEKSSNAEDATEVR